jgi:hypothetical protein
VRVDPRLTAIVWIRVYPEEILGLANGNGVIIHIGNAVAEFLVEKERLDIVHIDGLVRFDQFELRFVLGSHEEFSFLL